MNIIWHVFRVETDSCDGDDHREEGPSPVTKEISHQSEVQTTQKQAVNKQESSKPPKDQALFRCAHCEKTFTKSINLQYHTYRHTGNVLLWKEIYLPLFGQLPQTRRNILLVIVVEFISEALLVRLLF